MADKGFTSPEIYRKKVMRGWIVALVLAVASVAEYIVATSVNGPLVWLVPFMIVKGVLILQFFMHVSALRGGHAEGNH